MPTCFWILVVSNPTCLWWKRGPVGHYFGQVQDNVSKPVPIHGEHQSPATKLVLQPRSSTQTYNQEPNNIQQTYTKPTFSRSPKPTNDKQPTNQNTGRCCHHHARTTGSRRKRKSCPLAAPKSRTKNAINWEALHGETGFARVFGPQNEGHKFHRKRNSSLDTSMAKPTPKHLLRMVEREAHLECLGASVERPV